MEQDILTATREYERWLKSHVRLVKPDLMRKHKEMAESCFSFLRATFYRWAQLWARCCPRLARAPRVIAVGDAHLENFGTWRDKEGRLVWGANDFDEAFPLAYTNDLTRLAVSLKLAGTERKIRTKFDAGVEAMLAGYRAGLESGGNPFVLSEKKTPLREMVRSRLLEPEHFWEKLKKQIEPEKPSRSVRDALLEALPKSASAIRFFHRRGGLGSLGRERFIALADWRGGRIVREAKARAPSGGVWAQRERSSKEDWCKRLLRDAVRCPDPSVEMGERWAIRRLSPDCLRLDLADLPSTRDELELLSSMGAELANVHLGSGPPTQILKHLRKSLATESFLKDCSVLANAIHADWQEWREKSPSC